MTPDRSIASTDERPGWHYVIGIVLLAVLGSASGAAHALQLLEPVASLTLAIYLLRARRHLAFIECIFWLWIVSPEIRRFVDYHSSYHATSLVLTAPYVMALCGIPVAFAQRQEVNWWTKVAFLFGFAAVTYGTVVGIALDPSKRGVLADFLTWLPPLALGFFVLMTPAPLADLRVMYKRMTLWLLAVLGVYGILQWFVAPPWDTSWLADIGSAASSFGQPHPLKLRIWSMANSPGTFAGILVWLLITRIGLLEEPCGRTLRLLQIAVMVVGLTALGITQVRSAWIAGAIALIAMVWYGRAAVVMQFLVPAAVVLVVIIASGGPITSLITQRAATITSGTKDQSASARISFQSVALPAALRDPIGEGLGSTSAGVRADGTQSTDAYSNPDSGYLTIFRTFGSVMGVLILSLLLGACLAGYINARRADGLTVAWAAANLTVPITLIFGSDWTVFVFVSLAAVARSEAAQLRCLRTVTNDTTADARAGT